jgi:hypothetical protein
MVTRNSCRRKPALLVFFAFAFPLLNSCSIRWVSRTNYELTRYDQLVVSDSMSEEQPTKLETEHIQVNQAILLQNGSSQDHYVIHLENADFSVNGETIHAVCTPFKSSEKNPASSVTVEPSKRLRIDCVVDLKANKENKLAKRDSVGFLEIPYDGQASPMKFAYRLQIEDFN